MQLCPDWQLVILVQGPSLKEIPPNKIPGLWAWPDECRPDSLGLPGNILLKLRYLILQ